MDKSDSITQRINEAHKAAIKQDRTGADLIFRELLNELTNDVDLYGHVLTHYAKCLREWGHLHEATQLYRELVSKPAAHAPLSYVQMQQFAQLLVDQGQVSEALQHCDPWMVHEKVADRLLQEGKSEEGIKSLLAAVDSVVESKMPSKASAIDLIRKLAELLIERQQFSLAERYLRLAHQLCGDRNWGSTHIARLLMTVLSAQGKNEEARSLREWLDKNEVCWG